MMHWEYFGIVWRMVERSLGVMHLRVFLFMVVQVVVIHVSKWVWIMSIKFLVPWVIMIQLMVGLGFKLSKVGFIVSDRIISKYTLMMLVPRVLSKVSNS